MDSESYPRASEVFTTEEARSPLRAFVARCVRFEDITGTPQAKEEQNALPEELIDWLDANEFRHIGTYVEAAGGVPAPRLTSVSFVDPDETIRLSVRYNESKQFSPQGVMFTFYTYFEDGSAVVSWCVEDPRTESGERLKSLGTTGSLADDYERQRLQIAGRVELGAVPVRVGSIPDVRATYFHYYRQLIPDEIARTSLTVWVLFRALPLLGIGVAIAMLCWHIVR